MTQKSINDLSFQILGCCIEVHKELGPGLLENLYERCLEIELGLKGISFKRQCVIPIEYKGHDLAAELRVDFFVENSICLELKAVETIHPIHTAILMSYMKLLKAPKGILVNFHSKHLMTQGQNTYVNEYFEKLLKE